MDKEQIQLPALRQFIIRRKNPILQETVALEEIKVEAHGWKNMGDSAGIAFVTYSLDVNGEPISQDRQAFFNVVDLEETTAPVFPPSGLIH